MALIDGHIVSRPKYEPAQAFMGSLVHEIERLHPEFAWVQFVFKLADYRAHYSGVSHSLARFQKFADTPETKIDSEGKEYTVERKERRSLLYAHSPSLIKKAEEVGGSLTFVMGVQGMVAGGDPAGLSTFSHCSDEKDGLRIFAYRDPRILGWLVRRRFVDDVSDYFTTAYKRTRYEAPSFVLLAGELPYYIHMPTGKISLESLAPSSPPESELIETKEDHGQEEGFRVAASAIPGASVAGEYGVSLARVDKVAVLAEPIEEERVSRLRQLVNRHKRSFEIVHRRGATWFAISSDNPQDLAVYESQLLSLYGGLKFANTADPVPKYVHELADKLAGSG